MRYRDIIETYIGANGTAQDRDVQRDIADRDINRVQHGEEQNSEVLGIRESRQLERPAHIEEHTPQTPAGRMNARQQVREWELDPAGG